MSHTTEYVTFFSKPNLARAEVIAVVVVDLGVVVVVVVERERHVDGLCSGPPWRLSGDGNTSCEPLCQVVVLICSSVSNVFLNRNTTPAFRFLC